MEIAQSEGCWEPRTEGAPVKWCGMAGYMILGMTGLVHLHVGKLFKMFCFSVTVTVYLYQLTSPHMGWYRSWQK